MDDTCSDSIVNINYLLIK